MTKEVDSTGSATDQLERNVRDIEAVIASTKKMMMAGIVAIATQTIGVVWWAATLSANVGQLNTTVAGVYSRAEAALTIKRIDDRIDETRRRMDVLETRVFGTPLTAPVK